MTNAPKNNKKKADMDISSVMDKIVEDTIGDIEVVAPTPIKKQKKKRANKKANLENKLPNKKTVIEKEKKADDKASNKVVQPKKEVELFFPAKKNIAPKVQQAKPKKQTQPKKQAQPKKQTQPKKQVQPNGQMQPKQQPPQLVKPQPQAQVTSLVEEKKERSILKTALISLAVLALLGIAGVYGYFTYYYHDKFIPGTIINQSDCHEISAKEAEDRIRQRVEDYSMEISFRGGKQETILGEDINYAFVSDGSIERILKEQNNFAWFMGYFKEYEHDIPESITFDDDKLKAQYYALASIKKDNQVKPEDAYVYYQNKNFEVIPEVEGDLINDKILYQAVSDAIHTSARTCSAEEIEAYEEPKVRSDDAALARELMELNTLVNASILYKLPTGDSVLDGNMLRTWLLKDGNGHYVKSEEAFDMHIKAYVERMAEEVDTVGKEREFKMTGGQTTIIPGGKYGWEINQAEEIAELKKNLEANDKLEREPVYSSRELSTENNGFGDTYIEVNLNLQHLYVYQKGRLVLEADFVSGRMTSKRWTPPGIFTLSFKQKGKVLRGPMQANGSYEWESPVTYWMPFNRGIGFHDASWRSSYGGTIYKYSGSHGCINMQYKKAKALFEIIDKDMPIICFYPDGYSVRKG